MTLRLTSDCWACPPELTALEEYVTPLRATETKTLSHLHGPGSVVVVLGWVVVVVDVEVVVVVDVEVVEVVEVVVVVVCSAVQVIGAS